MTRIWVYEQMQNSATLQALVPGGAHASTALEHTPHLKPFILYRQTSDVAFFRGDQRDQHRRTGYMIFAHDVPGDYLVIDDIIEELKILFQDTHDPANGIVESLWTETSEDHRDDDMGTIMKYARIQITRKENP